MTSIPWTPCAVAGEEFHPRPNLLGHATFLLMARILTALGVLVLASAEFLATQLQRPVAGFYVVGGGLTLLAGSAWFLLLWRRPQPIRLVLGPDRLQLQQGLADVIDDVPYQLISEVAVLRFPKVAGAGERGLGLRLHNLQTYLAVWPGYQSRRQRDRQETTFDWFLDAPKLPWSQIAEQVRKRTGL